MASGRSLVTKAPAEHAVPKEPASDELATPKVRRGLMGAGRSAGTRRTGQACRPPCSSPLASPVRAPPARSVSDLPWADHHPHVDRGRPARPNRALIAIDRRRRPPHSGRGHVPGPRTQTGAQDSGTTSAGFLSSRRPRHEGAGGDRLSSTRRSGLRRPGPGEPSGLRPARRAAEGQQRAVRPPELRESTGEVSEDLVGEARADLPHVAKGPTFGDAERSAPIPSFRRPLPSV